MKHGQSSKTQMLNRRTVLTSGLLGATVGGLGLTSDVKTGLTSSAETGQAGTGTTRVLANPNVSVEQVYSQARNRKVDFVMMYPEGVPREGLPVCLMLHGRFGDARKSVGGLPTWLSRAVTAHRVPPFAFLAVDGGGNNYWHRRSGDDPMWMLLDEVPRWLAERRLGGSDGQPFAASGISMGGFGALVYARHRNEHGIPLQAAAIVSPALLTSWQQMRKRRAFASEQEWAALDPLRHVATLEDVPLGVWCGTRDRFIKGTRRFIKLADPEVASTSAGGHNSRYYRKALPQVVDFLGNHLDWQVGAVN